MTSHPPNALAPGYLLLWYRIERVLGQGGFGITYLATDTNLDQSVAIKEYLPVEFAVRTAGAGLRPHGDATREKFEWGLGRFIAEARMLARFDHPSIVRVHSVFEHNATAYMVMRYEHGRNLEAVLAERGTLGEREIEAVVFPILDGLDVVHRSGFIHRDIKPDNVYVREDGSPVLLDFGSARQALGSSRTLTILVAPGYAPFEQYYSSASQQGPWTDIYGLGATLYRAITGSPPPDAIARSRGILGSTRDVLVPACQLGRGRYSEALLAAVDHALCFDEKARPQSIAEWRSELERTKQPARVSAEGEPSAAPEPPATPTEEAAREVPVATVAAPARTARRVSPYLAGALVVLAALGSWRYYAGARLGPGPAPSRGAASPELPSVESLRADVSAAQAKLAALDDQSRERVAEAERSLAGLRAEIAATEAKRAQSEARAREREAEATRSLGALRAEIAAARKKLADADAQMRAQRSEATAALDSVREQTRRLDAERDALREQIGALGARVEEREKRQRALDAEIAGREARLAALERTSVPPNRAAGVSVAPATGGTPRSSAATARASDAVSRSATAATAPARGPGERSGPAATAPADPYQRALAAYRAGDDLPAFSGFSDLAATGHVAATYQLGLMYRTGRGTVRDDCAARQAFRRAAEAGHVRAQRGLAVLLATGACGGRPDEAGAVRWYDRAAHQKDPESQAALGLMYAEGRGTARNDFLAYAWTYVAARAGNESARSALERLAKGLEPQRREQAESLLLKYAQPAAR